MERLVLSFLFLLGGAIYTVTVVGYIHGNIVIGDRPTRWRKLPRL